MNDRAASPAESLAVRAARAGIADHYHGFWGHEQRVPEAVLRRALEAMGYAQEGPPPPSPGLPPVHVLREGETPALWWPADGAVPGGWQLSPEEEDQPSHRGRLMEDGGRHGIELPADLPIGYWRLTLEGREAHCLLVVAPRQCWVPAPLLAGERWWGCAVQLYALRSARNWGIGDFGDLRRLVDAAAQQGASFIGLSPMHALFPHEPESASPYSPSSRKSLNPMYLDVQTLAELSGCEEALGALHAEPFQDRLRRLREAELVDYAGVAAAKEEILQLLWRHFQQHEVAAGGLRGEQFLAYSIDRADTQGRHALFEAIQLHLHAADPRVWGWPAWPDEWRDPDAPAVKAFAREHAGQVQYRLWLQWLAEQQLEAAQRYALHRGMGIGLYCDLAVGVNTGGSDTWTDGPLHAHGMNAGAPPDPLNALGQDWGLPPWNPHALRAARYRPFIETVRANMRHAGALRMDHVMVLMRLFWTGPEGGTYVSYPLQDLLAILALESVRHRCMVIGEDLGTVAPAMREAMREQHLLSYRPLLFERTEDGGFKPPGDWQAQALAVVSTHDLPTLRGFWLGDDMELQSRLGLYPDAATRDNQVLQRAQDRARLLLALERESLLPADATVHPTSLPDATPGFVEAVHAYLARTPCWLLGVQLEEVTGQRLQVNVPGTTEQQFPNWRRKLSLPLEELASDLHWSTVAAALRTQRSGPAAQPAAAELPALDTALVPGATYRIQFHKGCGFADVARAVPYLHALGITHLYASPYLKARPGSTHGYDIVDHSDVNPEVGDAAALERLALALRRHGMHQILDIVPNHMGVLEADNGWWLEVLEHGRASPHARTFDIEWEPAAPEMAGRLLLPVLGDHYGRVLEAGEIRLGFDREAGEFELRYWNHRFPIDPSHYPDIFTTLPAPPARDEGEHDTHAVLAALLDAFTHLPGRDESSDDARRARLRDAGVFKRQLARLAQQNAWLAQWIDACVTRLNGQPGDAASFDALDALIRAQAYRLADWRAASDDVNYRRFFDVNTLAALRMERPEVFEATHRRVLQWLQDGWLSGLRIDHPDGLSDPQAYFEQLQARYAQQALVVGQQPRALYLVVEKILAEHEPLPENWPVHGDTGYRFAALAGGLFVDGGNQDRLLAHWREFTGESLSFDEEVYRCKRLIIETSLFSELNWLTHTLHRLTRANRRRCDFTRHRLRAALAEVAACFPVYRTYLRADQPASAMDRRHVEWAIAAAERRLGGSEAAVLDHLREVLLGEGEAEAMPQPLRARFLARWQQFTSPVTAKAVEDTAFYRHIPLLSLNDVGSDPRGFGVSIAAFHGANHARLRYRPHSLLGSSTHDSKRSEDLRARISVLSEDPVLWREVLGRLAGWAELYLAAGEQGAQPVRNDIWQFFQTLAGVWPIAPPGEAERARLRERMQAFMLKAAREAKRETSWTSPDAAYEQALAHYIDAVLRSGSPNPFCDELGRLTARIAPFGLRNSLSQLALKLTAPGVPDIYQGCERWCFHLVDPDNRRLVDFEELAAALDGLKPLYEQRWPSRNDWDGLHAGIADGRLKQLVTWRLLQLRRAHAELFRKGGYVALNAEGPAAEHAVAYARSHEGQALLVVATRLAYTLCAGEDSRWSPQLWRGTRLRWGAETAEGRRPLRWRNWLTGQVLEPSDADGAVDLQPLFEGAAGLPFAVLLAETAENAP